MSRLTACAICQSPGHDNCDLCVNCAKEPENLDYTLKVGNFQCLFEILTQKKRKLLHELYFQADDERSAIITGALVKLDEEIAFVENILFKLRHTFH